MDKLWTKTVNEWETERREAQTSMSHVMDQLGYGG